MKLLPILLLLLAAQPARSQSIDRDNPTGYLYEQFIASQSRWLLKALDERSNNHSDLRISTFFESWRTFQQQAETPEPLLDTLYRLSTDIAHLNAAGILIKYPSPTRYNLLFPQRYAVLPDNLFPQKRYPSPDLREAIETGIFYPCADTTRRTLNITHEYNQILNSPLWGIPIPGLREIPAQAPAYETASKYMELLGEWLPVASGPFWECDYIQPAAVEWLTLNESRTKALATISCDNGGIYRIDLAPMNGRWQIIRVKRIGEWCN